MVILEKKWERWAKGQENGIRKCPDYCRNPTLTENVISRQGYMKKYCEIIAHEEVRKSLL